MTFIKVIKNRIIQKKILRLGSPQNISPLKDIRFKKILFCPLSATDINSLRESIIGLACQERGADVSMLYLDTNLPSSQFYNNFFEKLIYGIKIKNNIRFSKKLGFNTYKTSDFGKKIDRHILFDTSNINSLEHKGILIGDLIVASTVRSFLSNGPEWDNPKFIEVANRCLRSAEMLISCYNEILDHVRPDKIVMSHGIYISWGILFRLARKRGIAVDVYGSSYRKNTLRFYHNAPNAPFPTGEWDDYRLTPLVDNEMQIIDSYIESRETQRDDNISLFDDRNEVPDYLVRFLENHKEKKVFCLFTNIAWDAFAFSKGNNFASMNEWIAETITFFNERDDIALIIKSHPAEIYHKTPKKYRVSAIVQKIKLNSNIIFVNEKANLKPFWIYERIDFGLIHLSTVAIEMAFKSIPVLTSGAESHYSHKGFTIDPESKDDYFEKLTGLASGEFTFSPDIAAAKRYMYFRFFREPIEFDLLEMQDASNVDNLNFHTISDLKLGRNNNLDIICNGILNNTKFISPLIIKRMIMDY